MDSFELDFAADATLTEAERLMLLRLLATGTLTEAQAANAVRVHQRTRSPLLNILVAQRLVDSRDYASHLAELTETGYASAALDAPELAPDEAFVRLFAPADLVRFQFCPLRRLDDLVVVLAVDATELELHAIVARVAPGAEVITLAATELDITRCVDRVFRLALRDRAVDHLRLAQPELSASTVFVPSQQALAAILAVLLLAALAAAPWTTLRCLIAAVNVFYLAAIGYKLMIGLAARPGAAARAEARADDLDAAGLPIYSILVPVFREPEVVPTLLRALERLDYPSEKLDVLILLEESDTDTIAAAKAARPPGFFRFIYVPPGQPQTKPKACNYGLNFCRGEYVTIFDAEDIPEPNQLKAAVRAFRTGPANLVCVQAALNYFNARQNYLTRMFTLEYSFWFDYMLPGLSHLGLPIPLGGTSNHFLVSRLRRLGAWDPYNVTEDADLGIRATVEGFSVGVISSTTYEEANSRTRNWIRQRSRWIKGYMQTWLVHNRRPLRLLRQIGVRQWLSYQFFIGGTSLTFLVNPLLWVLCLLTFIAPAAWTARLFPTWLVAVCLFTFVAGNGLGIFQCVVAVGRRKQHHLVPYAFTNPLYWWLHSIAAYMALWQLFTKPFYWEKTTHGLSTVSLDHVLEPAGPAESKQAA